MRVSRAPRARATEGGRRFLARWDASPGTFTHPIRLLGYPAGVGNEDDQQLTPDLPPPVEAPELGRSSDEEEARGGERPPDPEHGPGDDSASGEPPD
ncbi:hypothetical protein N566_15630 [Streptomycetaceae bacterium MP113-05]|nr:hypothetical protein N566_15630 [Streptomycetaceae bacterium MP113-05]